MENEKLNYLVESYVDNYIDNVLIQEVKLSNLNPKKLLNIVSNLIEKKLDKLPDILSTILKGGAIGGLFGILYEMAYAVGNSKQIRALQSMLDEVTLLDHVKIYIRGLKNALSNHGPEVITAGVFIGILLSLMHYIFVKKNKMSEEDAKKESIKMIKNKTKSSDKETKKIVDTVIKKFKNAK